MNRFVRVCYFLMIVLLGMFMILGLLTGKNKVVSHAKQTAQIEVYPDSELAIDEDTVEYQFLLQQPSEDGMALCFLSSHQEVFVFADGVLIYSLEAIPSIYGMSPGSTINMIEIPTDTLSITVRFKSMFPSVRNARYVFSYGDAIEMYRSVISGSLLAAGLSGLIISVGIALILYWIISRKRAKADPTIVYFGLFAVLIGLWSLNETDIAMIILQNRTVGSFIGYTLLILMPVPFIQFVRYFFQIQDPVIHNVLSLLSIVFGTIFPILHISGVAEYKTMATGIHAMMIMSVLYMACSLIYCIREKGFIHRVRANLIATVALMGSFLAEMLAYYKGLAQTDVMGKIGILVYIIVLAVESLSDVFRQIEEGRKAEYYKSMAETDVMTGLLNRSAFEAWEERHTQFDDIMIVTFDLNNLKKCNDTLGHKVGDVYITEAAHMIKRVFGTIGKCYRIGGDEFCAVISRGSKVDVEHYTDKLRREEEEFNQKSDGLRIGIAVGYALHECGDETFESTRDRADRKMYQNKKVIKENTWSKNVPTSGR